MLSQENYQYRRIFTMPACVLYAEKSLRGLGDSPEKGIFAPVQNEEADVEMTIRRWNEVDIYMREKSTEDARRAHLELLQQRINQKMWFLLLGANAEN